MTSNLGVVFGPTLLKAANASPESMITDTAYQTRIVEEMIINHAVLFAK